MASAGQRRTSDLFIWSLAAGALLGACSFQDFSYLQDGSGGSAGTSGGSSPTGGSSGSQSNGGTDAGGDGGSAGTSGGSAGASGSTSSGGTTGGTSSGGTAGSGGTGGSSGSGGSGGSAGTMTGPDVLDNPSWEIGTSHVDMPGWENEGDLEAAYIDFQNARTGSGRLGHWHGELPGYEVRTFQTVKPIPNGMYTFRLWVMRDVKWLEQYLFARDFDDSQPDLELQQPTDDAPTVPYTLIELTDIPVTNGQITVGIHSRAGEAGVWANMDDAELVLQEPEEPEDPGDEPEPEE